MEIDMELFQRLLHNLLNAPVQETDGSVESLTAFCERSGFPEALQPLFSVQALSAFVETVSENTLYEIVGPLDICLALFSFAGCTFFIGPYVQAAYSKEKGQALLLEKRSSGFYAASLPLYHASLPLLNSYQIQHIVVSCILSFTQVPAEFHCQKLTELAQPELFSKTNPKSDLDLSCIYRRYEQENHFLALIEHGNVAGVAKAFTDLIEENAVGDHSPSLVSYQSPIALVRLLARKAAERSGLSVVIIDEITQRSAQKMMTFTSIPSQIALMTEMLTELTQAVREHLLNTKGCSPRIVRLIEYMTLHYTQELNMETLCRISGFSVSRLSTVFKAETGRNIRQYIAHLRCQRAAELLQNTAAPINEICSFVGYPDNNYFTKVFRKEYGMTPSEYRIRISISERIPAVTGMPD